VEEIIMNLLGDLLKTAGDAMRLSSDLMRYKLETQKRAVKRGVSRIAICAAVGLIALGFVGAGIGLLLYGSYLMVAYKLGGGASGLIIGAASIVFAGLLILLACGAGRRS
jgi:hypothetical protein